MVLHWEYLAPLIVVVLLSLLGTRPMIRTAFAILANWIAGTVFVYATHIPDAWWFSFAIDAMAARLILHQPAGSYQAMIGATYMAQLLLHVVYAFSSHTLGQEIYWYDLTFLAYVQLLLMGGWICGKLRRFIWERRHPRLVGTASTTGLGPW